MPTLLYTDQISASGPSRSAQFKTERFQTDSYTIRASSGLNNSPVKYTLTWLNLTRAQAQALTAQFDDSRGVSLLQWTPPLENTELNFTVESYNTSLFDSSGTMTYQVSATLVKEFDL